MEERIASLCSPLEFLWVVLLAAVCHKPLVVPSGLTCPLIAWLMPDSSYALPFSQTPYVAGLCMTLDYGFALAHEGWGSFFRHGRQLDVSRPGVCLDSSSLIISDTCPAN